MAINLAKRGGQRTRADQVRLFHIALRATRESLAILELSGDVDAEVVDLPDHMAASIDLLIRRAE